MAYSKNPINFICCFNTYFIVCITKPSLHICLLCQTVSIFRISLLYFSLLASQHFHSTLLTKKCSLYLGNKSRTVSYRCLAFPTNRWYWKLSKPSFKVKVICGTPFISLKQQALNKYWWLIYFTWNGCYLRSSWNLSNDACCSRTFIPYSPLSSLLLYALSSYSINQW